MSAKCGSVPVDPPAPQHVCFLVLLALAVCAMTVPRLVINYGMDGDGIRGIIAGRGLLATGVYIPSRLPGNPLFEYFLTAISLLGGHVLTNLMVLTFYVLCIAAFRILAEDRDHQLLLLALFSLTPILVLNAVVTKDYIPGLAMLLWCYVCARRKQYISAYVLLGLAIGFRLPNVLFMVPLAAFLFLRGQRLSEILLLSCISGVMGLLLYAPIYRVFGADMLAVPAHSYHGLAYVMFTGYRLLMVFGPIATAGIIIALALSAKRIFQVTREKLEAPDPEYCLELMALLVFLALFIRHSDKSEYLIPAIPFFYLLMWRWLHRGALITLSVLIVSFAFVSVELKGGESGQRKIAFQPDLGIVVKDFEDRRELEALRSGVDRLDKSPRAVVIHGYGPVLGFENDKLVKSDFREISPRLSEKGISEYNFIHRLRGGPVFFVSGLSKQNVELLQYEGYRVYYFSESAPSHCMHTYHYDPGGMGLTRLDILNDQAFYKRRRTP
jgi:hypothetical protein